MEQHSAEAIKQCKNAVCKHGRNILRSEMSIKRENYNCFTIFNKK